MYVNCESYCHSYLTSSYNFSVITFVVAAFFFQIRFSGLCTDKAMQQPWNFESNDSLLGSDLAALRYFWVREQKHFIPGMRR